MLGRSLFEVIHVIEQPQLRTSGSPMSARGRASNAEQGTPGRMPQGLDFGVAGAPGRPSIPRARAARSQQTASDSYPMRKSPIWVTPSDSYTGMVDATRAPALHAEAACGEENDGPFSCSE